MVSKYCLLLFFVFFIYPIAASLFHIGSKQSAGATGMLLCNGVPASGILVKIYDDDGFLGIDDLMARGYTDRNGNFAIYGSAHEISKIDPKLNIYHDCNDFLPCQRKISIKIPDGAIYQGSQPSGLYSIGILELGSNYEGESRDCFHRR